jgi:hypothetical protein
MAIGIDPTATRKDFGESSGTSFVSLGSSHDLYHRHIAPVARYY